MIRITIGLTALALLCVSPAHADQCDAFTVQCSRHNEVGPPPTTTPTYDKTWRGIIV